jgi:hypothetical protein
MPRGKAGDGTSRQRMALPQLYDTFSIVTVNQWASNSLTQVHQHHNAMYLLEKYSYLSFSAATPTCNLVDSF